MAVDVIPGRDETLTLIEFVRDERGRISSEIKHNEERILMFERLKGIHIGPSCTAMIDIKAECPARIEVLAPRLIMWDKYGEALPTICPWCHGKRFIDTSGGGMMASVCGSCRGRGYIPNSQG